jgi:hypothetical protein
MKDRSVAKKSTISLSTGFGIGNHLVTSMAISLGSVASHVQNKKSSQKLNAKLHFM